MIELLLRAALDADWFEIASGGVRGWDRKPMDSDAAAELVRLGHSAETFSSQPIS